MSDNTIMMIRALFADCLIDCAESNIESIKNYHELRLILDEVMEEVIESSCDYHYSRGFQDGRIKE